MANLFSPSELPSPQLLIENRYYIIMVPVVVVSMVCYMVSKYNSCYCDIIKILKNTAAATVGIFVFLVGVLILSKKMNKDTGIPDELIFYACIAGLIWFFTSTDSLIESAKPIFVKKT